MINMPRKNYHTFMFYCISACCTCKPPFYHCCLAACAQTTLGPAGAAAPSNLPKAEWNWRSAPATELGPPLCIGCHPMSGSHHVWPRRNAGCLRIALQLAASTDSIKGM